ncbi:MULTISPECIES: hypothetical protein [Olivibacter]|jgi:hypothetical protein|uniref:Uncharacterized protein n=2 Tax=Olivibacter TaxID=376469 RepID=A0ABV6HJG8_9SPHI|nr:MULTISPECIES: hypothetical protein [Olivibacter]MCL4638048.1 hypothetical protein [Olivibacter sp. UJ_SKK_5.1]MDM8176707.1 hypothetical protein [Olivibacter sp. 47]MDX3912823.1 hypothetical protein [Pseudosphingobacterium sp.]QEL00530.1 hypothetical protein FKG96_06805 [Olivibacter sp. LS-1]
MDTKEITFVKKRIETNASKVYLIQLFSVNHLVTKIDIGHFCHSLEKGPIHGAMFHAAIFFDDKEFAAFPSQPMTYVYSPHEEGDVMMHIKAIYSYDVANRLGKLHYYDINYLINQPGDIVCLDEISEMPKDDES